MIMDYNNTPQAELEGFTPMDMHLMLYYPFDPRCPIKLNKLKKETLLEASPILKIIRELLLMVKAKKIKLTPKGNLPQKVMTEIYAKRYLPDRWIDSGIVHIRTETDWIVIHNVKLVLILAGLLRKQYNFLMLTKKGAALMDKEDYQRVFYEFLEAYALKFNWSYNDAFYDENVGQLGFLYSLFLINKYGGEKRDLEFYTDLYFKAFPAFVEYGDEYRGDMRFAYHTRFIERFALRFGLVEEELTPNHTTFIDDSKIKRTNLLEQLLSPHL